MILCAGVYGSAQLLMLSGVGPAEHLRQHGIAVVADLPVGDNLHDHMFVPMTYCMTSARNRGTTPYFVGGIIKEAIRGDTWMGRTVFEAVGFVRSPRVSGRRSRTSRCTRCRGPIRSPTRTHPSGRRSTSAPR